MNRLSVHIRTNQFAYADANPVASDLAVPVADIPDQAAEAAC